MTYGHQRPQFLLDVAEELTWLKEHAGAEVASRWYDALIASLEELHRHPRLGRERRDLRPAGIRSWRIRGFSRWLIFYAVQADESLVFYRVRSGTMNLPALPMVS